MQLSSAVKKILVRTPNWIGDQILAYPFFHYLRQTYPSAEITAACPAWVQSVQFRNLVNDVIVLPRARDATFFSRLDAVEKGASLLRQLGPWDLGISLPNSFSSAWLLMRSGVRVRRGYSFEGRGFLLNDAVIWKSVLKGEVSAHSPCRFHRSEAYLNLLKLPRGKRSEGRPLGKDFWGIPAQNDLDPGLPGVVQEFDAELSWPASEPLEPPAFPYWVLAPGSTAESRRWPASSWTELARRIYAEKGWVGVVVGGIAEAEIASQWQEGDSSLKLLDWTAQGTPASYWKVFKNAQFSVCNDSGLAHVACLCGSPVQVIWGGGNPLITEPIGPGKVQISLNPVDCWPCERNTCRFSDVRSVSGEMSESSERKLECLKGIYAEAVWHELKKGFRV